MAAHLQQWQCIVLKDGIVRRLVVGAPGGNALAVGRAATDERTLSTFRRGECFDDPAMSDYAPIAGVDHRPQFPS